jgi:hypothetical protein
MTKKHKRPRRSSALEGDEAEPLSAPLVDPTLKPKPRKRRGPYDPYPGWASPTPEAEFYRQIGSGPVAFTRPDLPPRPGSAAEPAERKPPPEAPHPASRRGKAR